MGLYLCFATYGCCNPYPYLDNLNNDETKEEDGPNLQRTTGNELGAGCIKSTAYNIITQISLRKKFFIYT